MSIDRRQFVGLAAAGAVMGQVALAGATPKPKPRPASRLPGPTPPGKHAVNDLPFDPAKLAGLSAALVVSHHETTCSHPASTPASSRICGRGRIRSARQPVDRYPRL